MKKIAVVLALSLAANLALVAMFFVRPRSPVESSRSVPVSTNQETPIGANRLDSAQLTLLQSGDVAQLRAAGFPEETIRLISVGRAYLTLQAHLKNVRPAPSANEPYWKNPNSNYLSRSKEQRAEMLKAQREFSEALRTAFGDETAPWGFDSRLAFLPAAKREQLRQIEQDYSEMESDIYSEINGVQLASDQEKIKLLQQEKLRDIAAALSPQELEQYNLRASRTAMILRGRYGDAIQSEEDYRKIYALQKAFDDQYSHDFRAETVRGRGDAERVLQDQIRAAIGEDNFAAFQKANDQTYKTLTSLVKRLDLPATTVDTVYASRDTYAAQSQQIARNATLSVEERRTQLKALATTARTNLESSLGKEGAEAFAQRADWLQMLNSGMGFTTDPKNVPAQFRTGNRSIYPVPPGVTKPATPPKT